MKKSTIGIMVGIGIVFMIWLGCQETPTHNDGVDMTSSTSSAYDSTYDDSTYDYDSASDDSDDSTDDTTGSVSSSFTNKYGTATTNCAHAGCDNYIASSGDTNCCTVHSNTCQNCGKYIDEDALYCMDCLSSTSGSSSSDDDSYSNSSVAGGEGKCKYKEGGQYVCTKPAEIGDLCKEHYEYLDDAYNSLTGY